MPAATHSPGVGLENFFSPPYQGHNRARLEHLASLGLPLFRRRVLELGSGPGDHTGFYVERKCEIVSVDSRQECLATLQERFPAVRTVLCDLNSPAGLSDLGTFDVIHCYGILYHLEDPAPLIQFLGRASTGCAIVETCVSPRNSVEVERVEERILDYTQSSTGHACRPTRQWVFQRLHDNFPFVYHTRTQPNHPEFPIDWNDLRYAPPLIRSVFVGSKEPLELPSLSPVLLDAQDRLDLRDYVEELESSLDAQRTILDERERLIHRVHSEAGGLLAQLERASAALAEKDLAIANLNLQLRGAIDRTGVLEQAAAERLAALHEKDGAIADLDSRLREAFDRAGMLEQAAAERLVALEITDKALRDTRQELQQAVARAESSETAAADRVNALRAAEASLSSAREELWRTTAELKALRDRFETEGLREYISRRLRRSDRLDRSTVVK